VPEGFLCSSFVLLFFIHACCMCAVQHRQWLAHVVFHELCGLNGKPAASSAAAAPASAHPLPASAAASPSSSKHHHPSTHTHTHTHHHHHHHHTHATPHSHHHSSPHPASSSAQTARPLTLPEGAAILSVPSAAGAHSEAELLALASSASQRLGSGESSAACVQNAFRVLISVLAYDPYRQLINQIPMIFHLQVHTHCQPTLWICCALLKVGAACLM
jgi:hypothetical protein